MKLKNTKVVHISDEAKREYEKTNKEKIKNNSCSSCTVLPEVIPVAVEIEKPKTRGDRND